MAVTYTKKKAKKIFQAGKRGGKQLCSFSMGRIKEHVGYSFLTTQALLDELAEEGMYISRPTFYRLEKTGLFKLRRSVGGWRVMTRREADAVKKIIWINYFGMSCEDYHKQEEEKESRKKENE